MIESKIVTHSSRKRGANRNEELFIEGFDLYSVEVERLSNIAWKYDLSGNVKKAYSVYKSIATYQLMHSYVIMMEAEQSRLEDLDVIDLPNHLVTMFSVDCIDKNLPCISKKACTDYTNVWEELLRIYGVNLDSKELSDCCIGIGQMIIGEEDDCKAFILSSCEELNEYINEPESSGDFNNDFSDDFNNPNT